MKAITGVVLVLAACLLTSLCYAGAREDAELIWSGETCGDFGQRVYVTNTGDCPIRITVAVVTYGWDRARTRYEKEIVEPGDWVYLGCTNPGGYYPVKRSFRIAGAYYMR